MAWANCYIVVGSSMGWPPVTMPVDQATNLADKDKKKKIKKALRIHIRHLAFSKALRVSDLLTHKRRERIYFQNLQARSSVGYFILFQ